MTTAATAAAAAGLSSTFFTIAKFTTLAASIVNIAVTWQGILPKLAEQMPALPQFPMPF